MDFEDWEYLSDDGKGNGKRLISTDSNCIIDMDYFQNFTDPQKKVKMDPIGASISPIPELPKPYPTHDWVVKEVISQDNEFADMKLDLPKSVDGVFTPQIEVGRPQFEEKEEGFDESADMKSGVFTPKIEVGRPRFVEKEEQPSKGVFGCNENLPDPDEKELENEKSDGGLNIWKMGLTGIGAVCSFAFATICVFALGSRHKEKQPDQNLHFQFYPHDKRMKRVVHHAAKLNEAISAVRGAPLTRAHISIGGYFEGHL